MKELRCADVGMKDCKFVAQGQDESEVMKKAAEHAKTAHGMSTMSPDLENKARRVIRETGGMR